MRVIAGTAKGIRLEAPKGARVRPTLDRVREALFSILGDRIAGARFLDLFAGTGANGIEALSRGAAFCTFVDNHPESLAVIWRNIEKAYLSDRTQVVKLSLPKGLANLPPRAAPYRVIFADPPHIFDQHEALFEAIVRNRLLEPGGLVVIEHDASLVLPEHPITGLARARTATYGGTGLTFFS